MDIPAALDLQLLYHSVEIAVMVGMVGFLYLIVYLLYNQNTGLFQRVGFDHRVVFLLMIGGLAGSVMPVLSNMPLFINDNSVMAINVGGAIIPVFLSFYFMHKYAKSAGKAALYVLGSAAVAVVTYNVTSFVPSMGVVVGFPMFAVPSVCGALIALVFFRRDTPQGAPLAYSITTLGVFIGADVVRIPQIMAYGAANEGFVGSMGGAGIMDMVFIAGLMAFVMVLPFSPKKLWSSAPLREAQDIERVLRTKRVRTKMFLTMGHNKKAAQEAWETLQISLEELARMFDMPGRDSSWQVELLERLGVEKDIIEDYKILTKNISNGDREHSKDIYTINSLVKYLATFEKKHLATVEKRVVAHLLDLVVLGALVMILGSVLVARFGLSDANMMAILLWTLVIDIPYFTITEAVWGQSLGKKMLGIKVMRNNYEDIDFLDALSRNVFRKVDELLLFYLFSIVIMLIDPKRRRIGDKLASTLVVDLNSFSAPARYAQPNYPNQAPGHRQPEWR